MPTRRTVVIIDDTEDMALLAEEYLAIVGKLHHIERWDFTHDLHEHDWTDVAVLVSDLMMPDVPGEDVLRWVRANHPEVWTVAWSAYIVDPAEQARIAGFADAVVVKGNMDELVTVVKEGLDREP